MNKYITAEEAKNNADLIRNRTEKNIIFDMIRDASEKGEYRIQIKETPDFVLGEDRREVKKFFESLGFTVNYTSYIDGYDNNKYYIYNICWDTIN